MKLYQVIPMLLLWVLFIPTFGFTQTPPDQSARAEIESYAGKEDIEFRYFVGTSIPEADRQAARQSALTDAYGKAANSLSTTVLSETKQQITSFLPSTTAEEEITQFEDHFQKIKSEERVDYGEVMEDYIHYEEKANGTIVCSLVLRVPLEIIDIKRKAAVTLASVGRRAMLDGDYEAAVRTFQETIRLDRSYLDGYTSLLDAMMKSKNRDYITEMCRYSCELDGLITTFKSQSWVPRDQTEKYEQALKRFRKQYDEEVSRGAFQPCPPCGDETKMIHPYRPGGIVSFTMGSVALILGGVLIGLSFKFDSEKDTLYQDYLNLPAGSDFDSAFAAVEEKRTAAATTRTTGIVLGGAAVLGIGLGIILIAKKKEVPIDEVSTVFYLAPACHYLHAGFSLRF